MNCPHCGVPADEEGAKFCGECGGLMEVPANATGASSAAVSPGTASSGAVSSATAASLTSPVLSTNPALRCPNCGAGPSAIADDGFCNCGTQRRAPPRNHFERIISAKCAGVSDIGTHHPENQDYIALGAGKNGEEALILLDGVSQSQNSMEGSKLAGDAALAAVTAELAAGNCDGPAIVKAGIVAAQAAICTVAYDPSCTDKKGRVIDPAESTIVLVLVQERKIHYGWAGDSRAYWVGKNGIVQITKDDSWADEQVAAGRMTMEEAMKRPEAHAITNSLGGLPDGRNPGISPTVLTMNVTEAGRLIICTDGFWNYAEDPKVIARLVAATPASNNALALARSLVNFARDTTGGGKDNISVIVREF